MASTTMSAVTSTLLGASITAKSITSGQTMTITATTAQSALDFKTLQVRVYNTTGATITLSLGVGTQFSDIGVGAKTLTTIANHVTKIIGGHDFEGARFLTSAGSIVFTNVAGGTATFEAYQGPRATE